MPKTEGLYQFGPFQLDPREHRLLREGVEVSLQLKAFEILCLLVENKGRLIKKEELLQLVWPDTIVEENNLNKNVSLLRKALGEGATGQTYIETVPRVGYRFVAAVTEIGSPPAALAETSPAPALSPQREVDAISAAPLIEVRKSAPRELLKVRIWALALGMVLIMTAVFTGAFLWRQPRSEATPATRRVMLAVLPFDNLTGDAGQDYFSDGLTEEMITQLGQLNPKRLGVIARTSVMFYKHSPKPLDQIGRELGVEYVIEGSVRRDSNNVRVAVQLIQVKDQTHLWARQYDRELKNLLALQGEIAGKIADEIEFSLGGDVNAANRLSVGPRATSYEAYDLYLKGRYFWNQRTLAGFSQAAEYFQQAIAKDPKYARAYAGLADTFGLMSTWNMVPQNEFMPKARAAALKALQIDASVAEAHTSLALVAENYDYDWQAAEKEFRQAIQLDPGYGTAHQWYAECLSFQGRFDEALAESERARQLDPLSVIIARDHGTTLYFSRQYDRAIEQFRAVREMDPNFPRSGALIEAYVQKGQFADALAELGK